MSDLVTTVILGLAAGSVYGLAGAGLVLTFSTSGVFNFAHGAVGAVAAYAFYEARRTGLPWLPAAVICALGVGLVGGILLERIARRVAPAPLHLRVVATVAVILVVEGIVEWRYGTTTLYAERFLPSSSVTVLGARVGVDRLLLVVVGVVIVGSVHVLLRRSRVGLAMRAVVDEPALLAQTGIDPRSVRRLSWTIGSTLAAASGILLAPSVGLEPVVLTFVVVQAFGAAALGRFTNPVATFGGGLLIGVGAALATRYLGTLPGLAGLPSSIPFVVLLAVLVGTRPTRYPDRVGTLRLRRPATSGRRIALASATAAGIAAAIPSLVGPRLPVFTNGAALVLVFVSLAVLVNASGQVSLCQAAFAAVGAAVFGHATTGAGLPWGPALVVAGLAVVPLGVAVAVPAARLSALALAIATFALGIVVDRLLYPTAWLFGASGIRAVPRPAFGSLSSDRGYFFVVASIALVTCITLAALLGGRWGRILAALSDEPEALAATGTSVATARVVVFSVAAFLAGVGGALAAAGNGSVTTVSHPPMQSLVWVAVLAIGGRGPIAAGVRAAAGVTLVPVYFEWLVGTHVGLLFGATALGVALIRSGSGGADRRSWRRIVTWRRSATHPVVHQVEPSVGAA